MRAKNVDRESSFHGPVHDLVPDIDLVTKGALEKNAFGFGATMEAGKVLMQSQSGLPLLLCDHSTHVRTPCTTQIQTVLWKLIGLLVPCGELDWEG